VSATAKSQKRSEAIRAAIRDVAFPHTLGLLVEQYQGEVEHLADAYRERIVAGEFSGNDDARAPKFIRLERELARHPWARSRRFALAVIAASPWALTPGCDVHVDGYEPWSAGSCLAQDVLRLARSRGWMRRRARRPA
jgi:hypothetical protein